MAHAQRPLTQADGPPPPIDLTSCDREPVHAPAGVQPFGAVLVARRSDRQISHASANLGQWIGVDAHAALGRDLAETVGLERAAQIGLFAAAGRLENNPFPVGTLAAASPAGAVDLTAYTTGEHLVVTAEPAVGDTASTDLAALKHTIERLRVPFGVTALCDRVAAEVRELTGFDRVMVYRFHPDHSGEVVAEAARPGLPTYLGLNYPAADIPAPAREIYKRVWVRVIPDAARPAVPLVPTSADARPVDLTLCPIRAVSPIHVEYLTNMGVAATMSLSLLRGAELWGLVACHHYSPRRLPRNTRTACEVVAQVASHNLIAAEDREAGQFRAAARAAHDAMIFRAAQPGASLASLADGDPGLLDLVPASGAAVRVNGRWTGRGDLPAHDHLEGFAGWLADTRPTDRVFSTDAFPAAYPPAAGWPSGTCGVLAIRVSADARDLLVWCRAEDARTVRWAGDPTDKPVSYGPHGPRLSPRKSFEEWRESVRGRSAPWTAAEIDEAVRLAVAVRELVLAQGERASRASELFAAVAEATTDAVFVKDAAGRYLFFNEGAARLVGRPAEDVLGKGDTFLFGPADAARVMENDISVKESGRAVTVEEELTAAGITRTYSATKAPYRDASGRVVGVVGISRDITDRKAAEHQLQAERDRLAKIVDAAPVVICSFQQRADGTYCFPYVSRRIEEVYGIPAERLAADATPVFDIVHPDDADRFRDAIAASARDLMPWAAEFRVRHPSRGQTWVEGRASPVRQPDGSTVWHGYIADVTERERDAAFVVRQNAILERITRGEPLRRVLEEVVRLIEAQESGTLGSVLLLDREGRLRLGSAPSLPPEYNATIDGIRIGPAVGSCGTAAYSREPVFIADIATDPRWSDFAALALGHGLKACWSVPIFAPSRGENPPAVFGTFAVYARVPRTPPPRVVELLARAERLASIAIERDRVDQALRESEGRYRALVENAIDGIFLHDEHGVVIDANGWACESLGYTRDELIGLSPTEFDVSATSQAFERLSAALVRGELVTFEGVHRRKDGSTFPVEVRTRQFLSGGRRQSLSFARDISTRRRAERELKESEERLQLALRAGRLGVWERDVRTNAVYLAPETFPILGLSLGEFGGAMADFQKIVHPDDREPLLSKVAAAIAAGRSDLEFDYRIVRPDGEVRWISSRATATRDADGRATRLTGVVSDVTGSKQADGASARLAAIVESSVDVIVSKSPDGIIQTWNPGAERLFGYTAAEVVGKSITLLFPPERVSEEDLILSRILRGERLEHLDTVRVAKDGRRIDVSITVSPIREASGRVVGATKIARDITDRKRAEDALRANERLLTIVTEAARVGMVVVNERYEYLFANGAYADILGLSRDQIVGRRVPELLPDGWDQIRPRLDRALAGEQVTYELTLPPLPPDPPPRWYRVMYEPRPDADGRPTVVVVVADVSEPKRAELEVRASRAKLAAALESMSDAVVIADAGGRYVEFNDAFATYHRFRDRHECGRALAECAPLLDVSRPDGEAVPVEGWAIPRALRGESAIEAEYHLRRTDTGESWVGSYNFAPIRDAGGAIIGCVLVARDITDRKRTAEALRESEERFRSTFEQAAVGMAHVALDGRFLRVNERLAVITGRTASELLAATFQDITHPDDLAADVALVGRLLAGEIPNYSLEKRYLRKGDGIVWVNITVSLRRDAGGEPRHFIAVIEDITTRKAAEAEVRESAGRLRMALTAARMVAWAFDPATGGLKVSDNAVEVFGLPPGLTLHVAEQGFGLVHPEDIDRHRAAVMGAVEQCDTFLSRFRLVRPVDGSVVWMEDRGQAVRGADGAVRIGGVMIDITARKEADDRLRESEGRLRLFVEHAPAALAMFDRDMRYLVASRRWVTDYRLEQTEFVGRSHYDLFPDLPAEWRAVHVRALAGEVVRSERDSFQWTDGSVQWLRWEVRPWFAAAGAVAGIVMFADDITDRVQSEMALRESEARFRTLVENLPDGVFLHVGGRLIFCNPACVRILGAASPDQIVGKSLFELLPSDDHEAVRQRVAQMGSTGQPVPPREQRFIRLDGASTWASVTASPIRDAGRPAFLVVLRDLTEQRRLEAELRDQDLMIREAGELAHVGGWGFDPGTGQGNWTHETARIHGLGPSLTAHVDGGLGLYAGEDRARIEAATAAAAAHGTPFDLELQLTTAGGERKWVRSICRPVVESGQVVRVRGSIQDITDRKRAEEEIRMLNADLERRVQDRTAELEAVNRELESFSYSVSHDLRAPIRHITGFTGIVLDACGAQLPAANRGHLEQVAKAARRMGQLVDDLLAFSRLGRQALRRQPVDTRRLVNECLRETVGAAAGRRIETRIGDLPPCAGDSGLLRQVWLNLLSNAVKYSGKRDPAVIEVGTTPTPEGTAYFVKDNGAGFDMQYADKLFEVFQRLHRADEFEGTGIGLALVQRIINRHGGRVWAEAEPGKGATFWFTLGALG